jgi:nucleotide-binding universal stress UspA family protein
MKILLAIDHSQYSEAATQAVIRQVRPEGTEVRVLHAIVPKAVAMAPNWEETATERARQQATELVREAQQLLHDAGFQAETLVEEADPRTAIVDQAQKWKPDLIVVGSHGYKGLHRVLIGSVAEFVARHATCPVQIVRMSDTEAAEAGKRSVPAEVQLRKILLAIDGSKYGGAAVNELLQKPWPAGTEVRVLSVAHAFPPLIPDPYQIITAAHYESLEGEQKRAAHDVAEAAKLITQKAPHLKVSTVILEGSPKKRIIEEAERWGADLILLGSHGHGPTARFLLGSVAQAVAVHAPCSVEIVRKHTMSD